MNSRIIVILLSFLGLYLPSQAKINIPESLTIQKIEARYTHANELFKGFSFCKPTKTTDCIVSLDLIDSLVNINQELDSIFILSETSPTDKHKYVTIQHNHRLISLFMNYETLRVECMDTIDREHTDKYIPSDQLADMILRETMFSWNLDSIATMLAYSIGDPIVEGGNPFCYSEKIVFKNGVIEQWQRLSYNYRMIWVPPSFRNYNLKMSPYEKIYYI